jgi:hypothetical protein
MSVCVFSGPEHSQRTYHGGPSRPDGSFRRSTMPLLARLIESLLITCPLKTSLPTFADLFETGSMTISILLSD